MVYFSVFTIPRFVRNVPCEVQGTRRVWYNRHLNLRLLIERGKHKLVTAEEWEKASPKHRQNMTVNTVWPCRPRSRVVGRFDFRLLSATSDIAYDRDLGGLPEMPRWSREGKCVCAQRKLPFGIYIALLSSPKRNIEIEGSPR